MGEIWRITLLTVAMATAATAVMLPAGLLLAWALARGRFPGRVLLETIVSLPLVMPPVATGLVLLLLVAPRGALGPLLATLGARPFRVFLTVTLPLALPAVVAGTVLSFARAIGEFGATMMIAGSIPGSTRTLAVAIYSFAETGRDTEAAQLVGVSAALAFAALWLSNRITARSAGGA